jgi:hypothetical protein
MFTTLTFFPFLSLGLFAFLFLESFLLFEFLAFFFR